MTKTELKLITQYAIKFKIKKFSNNSNNIRNKNLKLPEELLCNWGENTIYRGCEECKVWGMHLKQSLVYKR